MAVTLFKNLLHTLHVLQGYVHGEVSSKESRRRTASKTPSSGRREAALRRTIAAFIGCLKEIMQLDLAPVRRVHRPKMMNFGGFSETSYSDIAITHAIGYYDGMVGFCPDYSRDSMEYEETEGLDDIMLLWDSNLSALRMLPRIDLPHLESLQRNIESEHRAAEKLKMASRPKPFVYHASKRTGKKLSSPLSVDEEVYRLSHDLTDAAPNPAADVADAFFFVPGEPEKPFVTKIGGVPYRAADVPWPTAENGKPMSFLAQFCFRGSKDLVGKLPGDVLVIFAEDEQAIYPSVYGDEGRIRFEWYPLGLEDPCRADAVPKTPWKLAPCFGVAQRITETTVAHEGAKIGGKPFWVQGPQEVDGEFLCALGPVHLLPDSPANRFRPKSRKAPKEFAALHLGDAGTLNFFMRGDSDISWTFDCY